MSEDFDSWLGALCDKRQAWVRANRENDFDRGIRNATVEKYADPSHFIFELLQNAEDAEAEWVRFNLEPGRIVFEHDGRAFNRKDIEGITGIGNTTKLDDGHKIGCFGIGFKSVYVVTERPEVHSMIEGKPRAFAIEDLVVPKIIVTEHAGHTTKIVLPLREDGIDNAAARARDELAASAASSLLFLENIKRLEWRDGELSGWAEAATGEGSIRTIRSRLPDGTEKRDRFLILGRAVERADERKQYGVKAALRLNAGGDLVPEPAPTRLRVFFETEETTGLHFTIHGPFQLTDNRANIKREDPWNRSLIGAIAQLVADALPDLRDRGLINRSMLELLPNAADELPAAFAPILDAIVAKFQEAALIPAHGGGFATAASAIRGPSDLRDLLLNDGLDAFGRTAGRQWIVTGLRNHRAEAFLTTLKIEEWGYADFLSAFQQAFATTQTFWQPEKEAREAARHWVYGRSDEQLQYFYLALDAALRSQKRVLALSNLKFVRLESGNYHSPTHAVIAPAESEENESGSGLFIVNRNVIRLGRGRGKEVEQFLRRVGVRDVDERAYLSAIVRTQYKNGDVRPSREQHFQHMRRFVKWWKEHGDIAMFAGVPFIRGGSDGAYYAADDLFFGEPYLKSSLAKIYDGTIEGRSRDALWDGYAKLARKDLIAFLGKCGVESSLDVVYSHIPYGHPHWGELHAGFGGTRHTSTGTNIDCSIEELREMLDRGDPDISRIIWDTVRAAGPSAMVASFSPNQSWAANQRPSTLACMLRDAAWIPAKDGSLKRPREMTVADLAKGYTIGGNENWLHAVGFGEDNRKRSEQHKARIRAGELIGLPPELVDRLEGLSPETLAALSDDLLRNIDNRAYVQDMFPQNEARDPARRAERLAERAKKAPAKTYETRERSVRTSNGDTKALSRTYLEDHYTNTFGDMICQCCHRKMPFNLPSGTPYFESCEFLDCLDTEHSENYLALCPLCSAKWQYANPSTNAELRERIAVATSPQIEVQLAGEPALLRFTQLHFDDIRTVCDISSP